LTEKKGCRYLLFDEIQNIIGWERVVNALLAENKADIYITGSNSKLLSGELATHITGRFINIPVSTLSFSETLAFKRARGLALRDNADEFEDYLQRGGFPILYTGDYTPAQADDIVSDIYSSIIFRDLVEHGKIRQTELLSRVVKYIFENVGNIFSAKNIADFLKSERRKLDVETVYSYLKMLENVFAVDRVSRFDVRGKEILKTREKYYPGDHALIFATCGRRVSHVSGILESVVYHEFVRKGFEVYIGKNRDREIDFVAVSPQKTVYAQVTVRLDSPAVIEREFSAFDGLRDSFPKYVLSMDREWSENRNGIEQRYLPDFLLEL
jgi:predicted AAA+ superfamily ATPase